jgi:3-methyladenine DNA glycosylase/8-oxoguanine DNA glycosylase
MALETTITPRGPYSLALSARRATDTTRRFGCGVLTCVLAGGELASARHLHDGRLVLATETEAGLEQLRFVLGADDDHTPFLERFRDDGLLAGPIRHLKGLRPVRTATVTHALLRAVCSQLITGREAHLIEGRLIRASTEPVGELQAPPLPRDLAHYAPAELYRFRLPARKATALVRICRSFDPERLRSLPPDAAAARLERERGIGPYSVGLVWTQGLGRFDRGIVGDLGLLKVCAAIEGRWVDADDTARLLARYEEWAGLACVYLMAGAARGLVPLKLSRAEVRRERVRARYAQGIACDAA